MEEANRGPKRRWVECGFIEDERAHEVTFSKCHQGLFHKVAELSILYGVEITVITYSPHGSPFAIAHHPHPTASSAATSRAGHCSVQCRYAPETRRGKIMKLEEAKKEAGKIAVEPRERNRWREEAVADGMNVEELEEYVASLEGLRKLVTDSLEWCNDSDFYDRLLATNMDISLDLDAAFLAELQHS